MIILFIIFSGETTEWNDMFSIVVMIVLIKMTKVKSLSSFIHILTQVWLDTWWLNTTLAWRIAILPGRTIQGIAQLPTDLSKKHQQTRALAYQYGGKVRAHPHRFHFHLCGTSSTIPHRLNNASWSTSLLHIKPQCTTWARWRETASFPSRWTPWND